MELLSDVLIFVLGNRDFLLQILATALDVTDCAGVDRVLGVDLVEHVNHIVHLFKLEFIPDGLDSLPEDLVVLAQVEITVCEVVVYVLILLGLRIQYAQHAQDFLSEFRVDFACDTNCVVGKLIEF